MYINIAKLPIHSMPKCWGCSIYSVLYLWNVYNWKYVKNINPCGFIAILLWIKKNFIFCLLNIFWEKMTTWMKISGSTWSYRFYFGNSEKKRLTTICFFQNCLLPPNTVLIPIFEPSQFKSQHLGFNHVCFTHDNDIKVHLDVHFV